MLTSAVADERGLEGEYVLQDDARDHLVAVAGATHAAP